MNIFACSYCAVNVKSDCLCICHRDFIIILVKLELSDTALTQFSLVGLSMDPPGFVFCMSLHRRFQREELSCNNSFDK